MCSRILLRAGSPETSVRHYAVQMGPDLPVIFDGCSARIFVIELNWHERVVTKLSENQIICITRAVRRHETDSNRLQTGKDIAIC
jgi:hypothetical protein